MWGVFISRPSINLFGVNPVEQLTDDLRAMAIWGK